MWFSMIEHLDIYNYRDETTTGTARRCFRPQWSVSAQVYRTAIGPPAGSTSPPPSADAALLLAADWLQGCMLQVASYIYTMVVQLHPSPHATGGKALK